ncbi:MAG: CNNM domain-containing protein [Thermoguttaceae bacterium]
MLVEFIVSFSVAIVVSAMCSLAESVLLSLSTAQLVKISEENPKIGKLWEELKEDVTQPVTAILTLNTAAHTIGAAIAGASFAELTGNRWVGAFSLVFTFLMLQFTEILPKSIGVRYNKSLAFVLARPLTVLTYMSQPLFYLFRILNRPFEPRSQPDAMLGAVQEISLLTTQARNSEILDVEQEKIILSALRLSERRVTDVMIPISEVSMFSDNMSIAMALEIGKSDSHTRFPVYYEDNREFIIGYVNIKELIGRDFWSTSDDGTKTRETGSIASFVRPITKFDPAAKASDALNLLVKQHEHISLVYDATKKEDLGLLTLEDLVEELVGEIEDEFDRLPKTAAVSQTQKCVRVGGGTPLMVVIECVKQVFPDESKELCEELAKHGSSTRFNDWFEGRSADGITRSAQLFFGDLIVWIRRARRGQVFDAQIQRAATMVPRISPATLTALNGSDATGSKGLLSIVPDKPCGSPPVTQTEDETPDSGDASVGF